MFDDSFILAEGGRRSRHGLLVRRPAFPHHNTGGRTKENATDVSRWRFISTYRARQGTVPASVA
jgi:hypothetical protein